MRPTRLLLAFAAVALPFAFACAGTHASYPDASAVVTAQAAWCESLAKIEGKPDGWDRMAACKAATPTASAPYLRHLTTCVADRHEAMGDKTPDTGLIAADCNDEATLKMRDDEAAGREVITARCRWAERCAKVSVADCKAGVAKLETSQRILFTTRYNAAALHTIAACLDGAACGREEDAAYDACYKPVTDKLLWFPH